MNQKIISVISILAIAISIGTLAATSTNDSVKELKTIEDTILLQLGNNEILANQKYSDFVKDYVTVNSTTKLYDEVFKPMKVKVDKMYDELVEQKAATQTLSENQIELPETPPTKKSFYLKTADLFKEPKQVFGLNDPVYFIGNPIDTVSDSVTYRIFAPNGSQLMTSTVSIGANEPIEIDWVIPTNPESGIYTFSITDNIFSDSITFKVE